jgi:hypothetical protein
MRRSPGWLREALNSGELARAAQGASSWNEVARRLGVSNDALLGAKVRAINAGAFVPTLGELQRSSPERDDAGRAGQTVTERDGGTQIGDCDTQVGYRAIEANHVQPAVMGARTIDHDLADRRERAETSSLKARLKQALDQLEQCRYELDIATQVAGAKAEARPIERRERSSLLREATAVALASDWHIEETVDPDQVNGVNEYNLGIAHARARRFFDGFAYLIRYHQDHFAIRDAILWMGGDLITGYLREENLEHNQLSPVQAIAELHTWMADGIRQVLAGTDIAHLKVVCNSGNHGRLTEKVRPSTREANSIEWLLYTNLAREFAGDERVEFVLPRGAQTYVDVYDWTIRFTHGDETKFGGGVGGIMIPLRKAISKWQTVRSADLTCLGHYHQEHFLRDLIVNGSLIGYNSYSLAIAAPYEDPRQAFFLVDSRRFVSMPSTIWVTDHEP